MFVPDATDRLSAAMEERAILGLPAKMGEKPPPPVSNRRSYRETMKMLRAARWTTAASSKLSKGGERQIGWVALSANATGAHHLQLHAPPLPKSASEAKSSQSELLDAWIHCELSVGVTGSIARYQALQQSRANAFSVGAASRAKRGLHRKASVLFDPLNRPMAPQGTDEYIAPDGILSAISSASTVVGTVAVTAVTAGVSAVASAVGAIGRAASFVAPAAAPPAAAAPAPGGGGGEGDGLTSDQRTLLSALAPPKVRGKLPPRKWGKQPSREEVHALLSAASAAAGASEYELALRGYMRAFEVSRATPLLLSAANMHIRLGELDAAAAFCSTLHEQAGLSAEHKAVLARKDNEIAAARTGQKGGGNAGGRRKMSVWQEQNDQAQLAQLS